MPGERPTQALRLVQELSEELGRYLSGQPIAARPISSASRLWRWCLRNRQTALLAGSAAAALLIGTIASTIFATLATRQRVRADLAASMARAEAHGADLAAGEATAETRIAEAPRQEAAEAKHRADDSARMARSALYGARMSSAWLAWDAENTGQVAALLDAERPAPNEIALQGWEWRYLNRLRNADLRTLHDSQAWGYESFATFAPDGRLVASAGADRVIRLWDSVRGRLVKRLRGHEDQVEGMAFSPDGRTLASASWDKTVRLWDVALGSLRKTISGHAERVICVAFRPDGRRLASTGSDGTIRTWDVSDGRPLLTIFRVREDSGPESCLAYSPDGRRLASVGSAHA